MGNRVAHKMTWPRYRSLGWDTGRTWVPVPVPEPPFSQVPLFAEFQFPWWNMRVILPSLHDSELGETSDTMFKLPKKEKALYL